MLLAHPAHPEAGLQVPAGTIEKGETPIDGAQRELTEETGLADFQIQEFLGERVYDMRPFGKTEWHRRFFYHATFNGDAPARWQHLEHHSGAAPILIELFWWNLADGIPSLIGGHGDMLHRLVQKS